MVWAVKTKKKAAKKLRDLPKHVRQAFESLVADLQDKGPVLEAIGRITPNFRMEAITAI